MFDVGFWELAVVFLVLLLVVGPERLPTLANQVGRWLGKMRRLWQHLKQQAEQDLDNEPPTKDSKK